MFVQISTYSHRLMLHISLSARNIETFSTCNYAVAAPNLCCTEPANLAGSKAVPTHHHAKLECCADHTDENKPELDFCIPTVHAT
jgi:hypothetical protein